MKASSDIFPDSFQILNSYLRNVTPNWARDPFNSGNCHNSQHLLCNTGTVLSMSQAFSYLIHCSHSNTEGWTSLSPSDKWIWNLESQVICPSSQVSCMLLKRTWTQMSEAQTQAFNQLHSKVKSFRDESYSLQGTAHIRWALQTLFSSLNNHLINLQITSCYL